MNSDNQVFVKTFSRRNRQSVAVDASAAESMASFDAANEVESKPQSQPASAPKSSTWWIDKIGDQRYRTDDSADQPMPQSHLVQSRLAKSTASDIRLADSRRDQLSQENSDSDEATATDNTTVSPMAAVSNELITASPETAIAPESSFSTDTSFGRFDDQVLASLFTTLQCTSNAIDRDEPLSTENASGNLSETATPETAVQREETFDEQTSESAPTVFRAAWEVDQFDIPANVGKLFFDGELFRQIAEQMLEAVETGLASMLVTSVRPQEGRSTVAIGIAMAAAAAGIHVALLDADTNSPSLVDDLCIDVRYGWLEAMRGGLSISEVAVHAAEDGVTLLPLFSEEDDSPATEQEMRQVIRMLKKNFDLVIIDGPLSESQTALWCAANVESAVIVRDASGTTSMQIQSCFESLTNLGVKGIGVIENFSPTSRG